MQFARRGLHDQHKMVELPALAASNDNLALPVATILRKDSLNGCIAPAVTTNSLQDRSDVLLHIFNTQMLGQQLPTRLARRAGITLRQQQPEDSLRPDRTHGQGGRYRAVYATRNRHHQAAPA